MIDRVRMLISIPPMYPVAQVVGYNKGMGAIHNARVNMGRKKKFTGQNFWARGYLDSTVGKHEELIRKYIYDREQEDQRLNRLYLFVSEYATVRWLQIQSALNGSQFQDSGFAGGT